MRRDRIFNAGQTYICPPLHPHELIHRHHVVVHVRHDTQRASHQQHHDENAERQCRPPDIAKRLKRVLRVHSNSGAVAS
jgi:hypothetical protein